jgi:hypothetical protein
MRNGRVESKFAQGGKYMSLTWVVLGLLLIAGLAAARGKAQ